VTIVHKLTIFAAWGAFALICFVTLSPIGLRPETGEPIPERFVAYLVLGALFMAAYPRHFVKLAIFLAVAASGLEALQHLTPDRHGHLADAIEKVAGAWSGCAAVRLLQVWTERPQSPEADTPN
jgi:VanZ family protein